MGNKPSRGCRKAGHYRNEPEDHVPRYCDNPSSEREMEKDMSKRIQTSSDDFVILQSDDYSSQKEMEKAKTEEVQSSSARTWSKVKPGMFQSADYSSQKEMEKAKTEKFQSRSDDPRCFSHSKDEQNAEKIRASRGNKEAEVSFTGEAGLKQRRALCKKNPNHPYFFSVQDFNIEHLPLRYHDNLLVKYVRASSHLTCRLSVPHISEDRPDTWTRKGHVTFGTGWVERVMRFTEEDGEDCQCKECCDPSTETPKKTWGVVYLKTASSVVCNNEEARNTQCHFFYDSSEKTLDTVPKITGFEILNRDIEGDWCEMISVTHDVALLDDLLKTCKHWQNLRLKVHHKYLHNKYSCMGCDTNVNHDLCIIVSHPHGCSKTVTIGKWTQRQVVQKDYFGNEEIKYSYDNPTCPGCAGAPVLTLVEDIKLQNGLSHLPAHSQDLPGYHKDEINTTREVGIHQSGADCKKNPGHKNFYPLEKFNVDHLPFRYRDNLIVKYVKAASGLTCRLLVPDISGEISKTGPDSDQAFPDSADKGENFMMVGTGWVEAVVKYTEEEEEEEDEDCQCKECCEPGTETPKKTWSILYLRTANHVVPSDEVARETQCHFFYDSSETDIKTVPTLKGFEVLNRDIEEDWCEMMYVTHDVKLLNQLHDLCEPWKKRRDQVHYKYLHKKESRVECGKKNEKDKHDLCMIVSHPHGCSKTVTVGKWTKRKPADKARDGLGNERIKYSYDTPTCPGSSGAPIITLVEDIKLQDGLSHLPPHSQGGEGNDNSSGVGLDRFCIPLV